MVVNSGLLVLSREVFVYLKIGNVLHGLFVQGTRARIDLHDLLVVCFDVGQGFTTGQVHRLRHSGILLAGIPLRRCVGVLGVGLDHCVLSGRVGLGGLVRCPRVGGSNLVRCFCIPGGRRVLGVGCSLQILVERVRVLHGHLVRGRSITLCNRHSLLQHCCLGSLHTHRTIQQTA